MRHIESVVPGAAFVESRHRLEVLSLTRVEWGEEGSVFAERTEGAVFRAVVVSVAERLCMESCSIFSASEVCGQQRKCMVRDIIFKSVGYRIVPGSICTVHPERHISLFKIRVNVRAHQVVLSRS